MTTVLIVEDEPMVREINEKYLKLIEGFILQDSVHSIEKAKEVILKDHPDVILLDVFFPQGKGIDLLKWLRINNINSDVILITADKDSDTVKEAFRYGAVDYLIKPFSFERFKESLIQYKNRKEKLENIDQVEQEQIDQYIFNDSKAFTTDRYSIKFEKGINEYTCSRVINYAKNLKNKSFTAQEIADALGISRISMKKYLDFLEKEKIITVEIEYGKVGRPKNWYSFNKQ